MKNCLRIAISTAVALGVCAPVAAETITLFEATPITSSGGNNGLVGSEVDIDKTFAFAESSVTVYCAGPGTASVNTAGGTPPIVDNYMTAGDDNASICSGGSGIYSSPTTSISGTHCFSSGNSSATGAIENGFDSTGVTASVDLVDGENDLTFKLWDYGVVYGNTELELALPENCSADPIPDVRSMCAGQYMDIGDVIVTDDADYIYVLFDIDEIQYPGWYLAETHVDIDEIETNKSGNPVPGKFPYRCELNGSLETQCMVTIPRGELSGDVEIAAHAAVFELGGNGCGSSPILANETVEENQGLRNDYPDPTQVLLQRSNPESVWVAGDVGDINDPDNTGFYSLGFGGSLTVGFGFPVYNAPGDDICIQEVTGTNTSSRAGYPEESANIYGVADGADTLAGSVSSLAGPDGAPDGRACVSLDDAQMMADSVKIMDTTIEPFPRSAADGYDIDWVGACYLYLGDETAWGAACGDGGTLISEKGNWATQFTYTIQTSQ